MDNLSLAALTAVLYVVSLFSLRYMGRTVPVLLIGLPVILFGLGAICAFASFGALAFSPYTTAALSLVAGILSAALGYKIANDTFSNWRP
jgi:hypothetical protein